MPHKIIVVGDSTDHGRKVISGSPVRSVDGLPIARLGDEVDCPQHYPGGKPYGVKKIITAHPAVKIGDVPVAVEDCVTECGCKLIGSKRACTTWTQDQHFTDRKFINFGKKYRCLRLR